ncbi:hypothetical protein CWI36_1523p0020, partial [Hamiltosporidium magnivora]
MGRRKKVDSENIKNDEINAVNNSEISFKEIKTCDRDVVTITENFHHNRPSIITLTPHRAIRFRLLQSACSIPHSLLPVPI